jgi:hypothetical protein
VHDRRRIEDLMLGFRDLPPSDPDRSGDAELWCESLGRWVHGFSVVSREGDDVLIRRQSDGAVLPVPFPATDVRLRDES